MRDATEAERQLAIKSLAKRGFPEPNGGWTEQALLDIVALAGWEIIMVRDDWGRWRVSVVNHEEDYRETSSHPDRVLAMLVAVASMVSGYPPPRQQGG
jgi:hypothetical protein